MESPELLATLGACARVRARLADAEGMVEGEERRDRDLGAFYLYLAVQECIDLATHWVAEAGWPVSDDAGGSFALLADRGVLDRSLGEGMRVAVGLHNQIGHDYAALDPERIGRELPEGARALREFLAAVAEEAGLQPSATARYPG